MMQGDLSLDAETGRAVRAGSPVVPRDRISGRTRGLECGAVVDLHDGRGFAGRGLFDPDTVKVSDITVPEPAQGSSLPAVADIAKLRGNAKRGAEAAAACLMCHRLGGRGVDYGPAIEGFARRQTRDVVITAIVNPSNDIAHGYEGSEITLVDGRKLHGLVLSCGNPLIVQSTGGVNVFTNAGVFNKQGNNGLTFQAPNAGVKFNNSGTVVVGKGVLTFSGGVNQVSGTTLTAGKWTVSNGTTLTITGANIRTIGANSTVTLIGSTATFTGARSRSRSTPSSARRRSSRLSMISLPKCGAMRPRRASCWQ